LKGKEHTDSSHAETDSMQNSFALSPSSLKWVTSLSSSWIPRTLNCHAAKVENAKLLIVAYEGIRSDRCKPSINQKKCQPKVHEKGNLKKDDKRDTERYKRKSRLTINY
jgi:hypothetical protein